MTVINRESVREILVDDLKKEENVCSFRYSFLLTPEQKHQHSVLSVEFIEMVGDERNALKEL
jgi:hypothetical protein